MDKHLLTEAAPGGFESKEYKEHKKRARQEAARMREELKKKCRIVGGPMAVSVQGAAKTDTWISPRHGDPMAIERLKDEYRAFVAVTTSSERFAGYLCDCTMYEIDYTGKVISVLTMPRVVLGSDGRVVEDGVIWRCQRGAVAKLAPSIQSRAVGMGITGKSDCVGRLAWYCQPPDNTVHRFSSNRSGAWLSTPASSMASCFTERTLYRLAEGGYIAKKDEKLFRFPIARVCLPSMKEERLMLVVPFTGRATRPKTNFQGAGASMHSLSPIHLALTWVDAYDEKLLVRVDKIGKGARVLVFELPVASTRPAK
jgi:hypothetical protein